MRLLEDQRARRSAVIVGAGSVLVLAVWLLTPRGAPAESNTDLARIDRALAKQDVATLADAARGPDSAVAARAVQALGTLGGTGARDAVRSSMRDARWQVRQASAVAWGRVGDRQDDAALSAMIQKDPSPQVRQAAAAAASRLKALDTVPALIAALDDPDRSVREGAMNSLDNILGILVSHMYRPDDPPNRRKASMAKVTQWFSTPGVKEQLTRYYAEEQPKPGM